MAIRLSHSCANCSALNPSMQCKVHDVKVTTHYTCDSFAKKMDFDKARECSSCARFEAASCAHPQKAAAGMLCSSWTPQTH